MSNIINLKKSKKHKLINSILNTKNEIDILIKVITNKKLSLKKIQTHKKQ